MLPELANVIIGGVCDGAASTHLNPRFDEKSSYVKLFAAKVHDWADRYSTSAGAALYVAVPLPLTRHHNSCVTKTLYCAANAASSADVK